MSPDSCEVCGEPLLSGAFFCGECGSSTRPRRDVSASGRTDTRILESATTSDAPPHQFVPPRFSDEVRIEPLATAPEAGLPLLVTKTFANGDAITVTSGGLLGRNPVANPGEIVDHLIIVTDPDRTVSKTHLEFGIEGESFWVCDRFSGNGTVVHESGKPPRRLVPGRHYRVESGSTVRIGEQSFRVTF